MTEKMKNENGQNDTMPKKKTGGEYGPKVKNSRVIRKVARSMIHQNKGKSIVTILGIALCTFLFTALFTVGGSILMKLKQETERQVGGTAMGAFKYLNEEEYEKIASDTRIKEISRWIYLGEVMNPEMVKLRTEVHWSDELSARKGFCYPGKGHLPEAEDEIVASDLVLQALGVPVKIGEKVSLDMEIKQKRVKKTFTLCGYFQGDRVAMSQIVLVSKAFQEKEAPTPKDSYYEGDIPKSMSDAPGLIDADIDLYIPFRIRKQLEDIAKRDGLPEKVEIGVNWSSLAAEMDGTSTALVIVLFVTIFLSGYLIISNVYRINVYADIRAYGLLKTIGMSSRQLKKLVIWQAVYCSIPGIVLGLIGGILVGTILLPLIMQMLVFSETTTDQVVLAPWIPVFSAVFSYITVWFSCRRPAKIASKVSPMEALRYRERVFSEKRRAGKRRFLKAKKQDTKNQENKNLVFSDQEINNQETKNRVSPDQELNNQGTKKQRKKFTPFQFSRKNLRRDKKKVCLVILSLSLSLVVLNSVYSLVGGFDEEQYVRQFIANDFSVADATVDNSAIFDGKNLSGISETFLNALKQQDGITELGNVYLTDSVNQQFTDTDYQRLKERLITSPYLRDDMDMVISEDGETYMDLLEEGHSEIASIYGMDPFVARNLTVLDGSIDWEKFQSGRYILVNEYSMLPDDVKPIEYFKPGETITVQNEKGKAKEYEVMAAVEIPMAIRLRMFSILDLCYILPSGEYLDFCGKRNPMRTVFDVEEEKEKEVDAWLTDYTTNIMPSLDYASQEKYKEEFRSLTRMFEIVGGLLAGVLAIIGILNLVNTMVTSILARRLELAMLEAVGMTKKLQIRSLYYEGMIYAIWTGIVGTLLSVLVSMGFIRPFGSEMWFYTWKLTLFPVVIVVPVMLVVAMVIPFFIYRIVMRDSVVERLKMAES